MSKLSRLGALLIISLFAFADLGGDRRGALRRWRRRRTWRRRFPRRGRRGCRHCEAEFPDVDGGGGGFSRGAPMIGSAPTARAFSDFRTAPGSFGQHYRSPVSPQKPWAIHSPRGDQWQRPNCSQPISWVRVQFQPDEWAQSELVRGSSRGRNGRWFNARSRSGSKLHATRQSQPCHRVGAWRGPRIDAPQHCVCVVCIATEGLGALRQASFHGGFAGQNWHGQNWRGQNWHRSRRMVVASQPSDRRDWLVRCRVLAIRLLGFPRLYVLALRV